MKTVNITSRSHTEMKDITREVNKLIPTGFKSGICHLFCMHTTAGLTINENADPDVVNDMIRFFESNVPWNDKKYRHMEGNTAAHIKSTLFGPSLSVPIEKGKLLLGTWQSIYFCEFDGPRSMRKVDVRFIADIEN